MPLFRSLAPPGTDPLAAQREQYLSEVRRNDYEFAARRRAEEQTSKMTLNQMTQALREGNMAGTGRALRTKGTKLGAPELGAIPALQGGLGAVGAGFGALSSFEAGDYTQGALQGAQAGAQLARGIGSLAPEAGASLAGSIGQVGTTAAQYLGPVGTVAGGLYSGGLQAKQISAGREALEGLRGASKTQAEKDLLRESAEATGQAITTGGASGALSGAAIGGLPGAAIGAVVGTLAGAGQQFQEVAKIQGTEEAAKATAKGLTVDNPLYYPVGTYKAAFDAVADWF